MKTKTVIPNVGRRYDAYNDGKFSPSRLASIIIDKIVTLDELSKEQLSDWRLSVDSDFDNMLDGCIDYGSPNRFWDWGCNTFAIGHFKGRCCDEDEKGEEIVFALREGGDWYGVEWNYLLDVRGYVRRRYRKMWMEASAECGERMLWNRKQGRFEYIKQEENK